MRYKEGLLTADSLRPRGRRFSLLKSPKKPRITDSKVVDKTYKYWRIRILYSTYIGYACFYLTRKSFTFIMPAMLKSTHFTAVDLGLLSTAFYITYGISKFISGMLSDKSNPRYFMAFGLIATGIANILFGLSTSLALLVLFWIINGYFQGWGWPPCARLLTKWYAQKERGVFWGIWNTSHNVGGALIPLVVGVTIAIWGGWRYAMFIPGAIAIAVGFVIMNRLNDVPSSLGLPPIEEYRGEEKKRKARKTEEDIPIMRILKDYVLNNKYIWLLALSYVLIYIVRTAINDWGAVYLSQRGFSVLGADGVLSFFEVGGFFGSIAAGWMSDKLFKGCRGQTNVLYSIGIIAAILAFWLIPTTSFVLSAALIFSIGFLVFGPQMLIGMAAAELSHKEAAGTATGFVGLFAYLGAALSGYPIGVVVQNYGWAGFFAVITACSVLSVGGLAYMWSVRSNPTALDGGVMLNSVPAVGEAALVKAC